MAENAKTETRKAPTRHLFVAGDGTVLKMHEKSMHTMDKKLIPYVYGSERVERAFNHKGHKVSNALVTPYDPDAPWTEVLRPSKDSPLCQQCAQFEAHPEPATPFMPSTGAANPLITVILDGISVGDDKAGALGEARIGSMASIKRQFEIMARHGDIDLSQIRWLSITRCAGRGKGVNLRVKGNWCRYHVIDDLIKHPPKLIIAVGSPVLAHLSHKTNANDWSGRVLTYRGWPDNWLTEPRYMLPRPHPADPTGERKIIGHPLFGPPPTQRTPLVPLMAPWMATKDRNYVVMERFSEHLREAVKVAKGGWTEPNYNKPWYRFTEDADEAVAGLNEILRHPGLKIAFDTETTGLRGWLPSARIVSMMFRWVDPETGEPRSIGFPYNFPESAMLPHLERLSPLIWKVLCRSTLIGHNLTFDLLYTFATFCAAIVGKYDDRALNLKRDRLLCSLVHAGCYDTWHMAFVFRQQRERLGLEHMAYRFVPDMAGYEEEMTLLIDLLPEDLNPENQPRLDAHYLKCPREKWNTHLVPYVMGDVETTYKTCEFLEKKLEKADQYDIPLAKPNSPGRFRLFRPPRRNFVYEKIMSPAAQVLTRMMARGMYVDQSEVEPGVSKRDDVARELANSIEHQKQEFLKLAKATKGLDEEYIKKELDLTDFDQLDLDSKNHLHKLFFNPKCLNLPVCRLTKKGRELYGETPNEWYGKVAAAELQRNPNVTQERVDEAVEAALAEYAAIDKFTLNQLSAKHAVVQPLLEYRKLFKLQTAYINPLMPDSAQDKKGRLSHLAPDGCVHASFLLTGTRGGRLSCRDPNLQQLPRDGIVKALYTSRFGARGCVYQADLSQIELRLMAAACGDPTMVKAYKDDIDLHSLTASRIYNIPYEHFTKAHMEWLQKNNRDKEAKKLELDRVTAKTVNFLTGYGGGAFGLQNVLATKRINKDIEECQQIIELFFDSYPALRTLLQYYKRFILDNLCAVTVFGRVRFFEEAASEDGEIQSKALRAGCNHLIQSTASDMMLIALFVIEEAMRQEGLESLLVSTVHDSLVVDAIRDELPIVHEIVYGVLNNFETVLKMVLGDEYDTSWMLVPIAGDCEVGLDYLNTRKIPKKDADWDKLLAA